jgi:hypothetical protein
VTDNTDCYDANANAHPGQTSYFTVDRGDGSFDYNCNGSADKKPGMTSYISLCSNDKGGSCRFPGCVATTCSLESSSTPDCGSTYTVKALQDGGSCYCGGMSQCAGGCQGTVSGSCSWNDGGDPPMLCVAGTTKTVACN